MRFTEWILVGDATLFPVPSKVMECSHRRCVDTHDLSLVHLIFEMIV